jgi:ATP-dependent Clp protease ATP-binding subunit ClpA
VIGQDEAIIKATEFVQTFIAGFHPPDRPIGIMLLLGPTGSGKTRLVEATAEALFDNPKAFFKVNCAEYQDSHQTNRLVGAPPGYIGYEKGDSPGLSPERPKTPRAPARKPPSAPCPPVRADRFLGIRFLS